MGELLHVTGIIKVITGDYMPEYLGFDRKMWTPSTPVVSADSASITFRYLSPDGEEGFPGTLQACCS
jgi:hypothetical protein